MKKLADILYKAGILEVSGTTEKMIGSVCFDSRKVVPGSLFVAVKGTTTDGHLFIPDVVKAGAAAIVHEQPLAGQPGETTFIRVKNSMNALGMIASNFYDNPSEKLKLTGVTGTNGKTTIATLLHDLFMALGHPSGLFSTVKVLINNELLPATHTTPDAISLNSILSEMVEQGCTHCFMEVSSHSADQDRIAGLQFSGGIFTNLTLDHLDYHKTFDEYLKAKKKFFDQLPPSAFALVNADDRNGKVMLQNTRAKQSTYSLKKMADFRARILENQFSGLHLMIDGQELFCRLVGQFNAYNLLAVYGAALLSGEDKDEVLTRLSALMPVEGRFDTLSTPDKIVAIVDYAHTPDALANVLDTIISLRTGNEKLITVVGAGGDRDRSKRPLMAGIAARKSDRLILTSDNPRSEKPEDILEEMQQGVEADERRKVLTIVNRREAIRTACAMAAPGDIILVAGKGHEKYQEIRGVKYPFDDKQILAEELKIQSIQ